MSPHEAVRKPESSDSALVATPQMCHYCFDVLVNQLLVETTTTSTNASQKTPTLRHSTSSTLSEQSIRIVDSLPGATISCPLFITWDKRPHLQSEHYHLRGCIGTLSPRPLVPSIRDYALTSAFRDRRFDPIHIKELPYLRVGVSLLVKYEECLHCHDWIVGVHGIIIRFRDANNNREYSATYLPEVASDQQWTQQEAVQSLVRKAGYRGTLEESLVRSIQCTRYQSSKQRVTYQDYVDVLGGDPTKMEDAPHRRERQSASTQPATHTSPCNMM